MAWSPESSEDARHRPGAAALGRRPLGARRRACANEEGNVEECLDALIKSDSRALRIRLMDDGSMDRTAEIARAVACRDPRVDVITLTDCRQDGSGRTMPSGRAWQGAVEDWLCS